MTQAPFEVLGGGLSYDAAWSVGGDVRGRARAQTCSLFPTGPQNSRQTKVLSCMDNTRHTTGGDEGFGRQSFLSQLELENQVKREKLVIWFSSLVLLWESGRGREDGGGWRVCLKPGQRECEELEGINRVRKEETRSESVMLVENKWGK